MKNHVNGAVVPMAMLVMIGCAHAPPQPPPATETTEHKPAPPPPTEKPAPPPSQPEAATPQAPPPSPEAIKGSKLFFNFDDFTIDEPGKQTLTKIGDIRVHNVAELKDVLSKQGSNFQIEGVYPDNSHEVYYYGINDFKK